MNNKREVVVQTFNGRMINVENMEHQHLSNWHWYNKIILQRDVDDIQWIYDQLEARFDSEILPYNPRIDFYFEIGYLYSNGYVDDNGCIKFEDEIVGKIDFDD